MPNRQRMIKPDFWIDEKLGAMSRDTRLLYVGLWGVADDECRLEYSLTRIRAMLFPYDTLSEADMKKMIQPLIATGRVVLYAVDGEQYAWLPKMADHQKIDHPTASKLPSPEDGVTNTQEDSRGFANNREDSPPIELNVTQENSTEGNSSKAPAPRKGKEAVKCEVYPNVHLSKHDHENLIALCGEAFITHYADRKAKGNYTYSNDNRAIRQWWSREQNKEQYLGSHQQAPTRPTGGGWKGKHTAATFLAEFGGDTGEEPEDRLGAAESGELPILQSEPGT